MSSLVNDPANQACNHVRPNLTIPETVRSDALSLSTARQTCLSCSSFQRIDQTHLKTPLKYITRWGGRARYPPQEADDLLALGMTGSAWLSCVLAIGLRCFVISDWLEVSCISTLFQSLSVDMNNTSPTVQCYRVLSCPSFKLLHDSSTSVQSTCFSALGAPSSPIRYQVSCETGAARPSCLCDFVN